MSIELLSRNSLAGAAVDWMGKELGAAGFEAIHAGTVLTVRRAGPISWSLGQHLHDQFDFDGGLAGEFGGTDGNTKREQLAYIA